VNGPVKDGEGGVIEVDGSWWPMSREAWRCPGGEASAPKAGSNQGLL
jgi:hypothetical protein